MRRALGVKMEGTEKVYDSVNILFHANLTQWVKDRPAALYFVELDDLRGTFLTINGTDRWGFLIHSPSKYGWTPEDFTPEFCVEPDPQGHRHLRYSGRPCSASARGRPPRSCPTAIASATPSSPAMPRMKCRRPAASGSTPACRTSRTSPGRSRPCCAATPTKSLLDSYHAERQPLGTITTQNSLANAMSMGRTENKAGVLPRQEFLAEQGLIFGASYESTAVVPDGTPAVALEVTEYIPSARPGCRAPHVWLKRGNEEISSIDLIGPRFVLMAGAQGEAWRRAAQGVAPSWPPLVTHVIGKDTEISDPDGNWHAAYGIEPDGAVLVRPDGYVAWRSRSGVANPESTLREVFDRLLGTRAGDGPGQLAHADRVAEFARLARRDVHQAGLVGELAVEIDRAGKAVPRLDAEERRAARFRPDAELAKSLP